MKGAVCSRCVFYTAKKLQRSCFSEPRSWGQMAKAVFYLGSWIVEAYLEKTVWFFYFFITATQSEILLTAVCCPKEVAVMGIGPYGESFILHLWKLEYWSLRLA